MGFLKEFKEFALKGNVVDMAVGVIIGGAFGKIVTSLVNNVIMPPIGYLMGDKKFTDLSYVLKDGVPEHTAADGSVVAAVEPVELKYGAFIQECLDFAIIALSIFVMIKVITRLTERRKKEAEAAPVTPPAPSKEETLLTEIRDLLKEKK